MRKTLHFDEIDSTSNYLLRYVAAPDEEQTVAVAEFQTAGRGQGTNHWESQRGKNLLFSVLTHPMWLAPTEQFYLSMAGALALKDALSELTTDISLKWPNDIYWRDCKLSGTLIETKVARNSIRDCIFGVGLNVNQECFRSDAPNPVSLCQITGCQLSRIDLLEDILQHFDKRMQQLLRGEKDNLYSEYRSALFRRGEVHTYETKDGQRFLAQLETVERDGRLCLTIDTPAGKQRRWFAFKEVAFVLPTTARKR